jgi:hypothetical protein
MSGKRHLAEVGMGYGGHLGRAWKIGAQLAVASGACFIHGLIPGMFTTKASRTIVRLHEEVHAHPTPSGEGFMLEFEI